MSAVPGRLRYLRVDVEGVGVDAEPEGSDRPRLSPFPHAHGGLKPPAAGLCRRDPACEFVDGAPAGHMPLHPNRALLTATRRLGDRKGHLWNEPQGPTLETATAATVRLPQGVLPGPREQI